MRSIRGKLIVGVVPGLVLLVSALSAALYVYMHGVLVAQLDSSLVNRAHVVIARTHWSSDYPATLVSPDGAYGEFGRSVHPSCFEIFSQDGTPVIRSQLFGSADLPMPDLRGDEPVYADIWLPNGRPGRAVAFRYTPAFGPADGLSPQLRQALTSGRKFTVILAKDAYPIRWPALVLLCSLIALVVIMATGIIVLMSLALRRGLQPLEQISRQAATRSPDDSSDLFPTDGMPSELLPICDRLNDLVSRLYGALQRQRRFTADAAHELRTPIAEIRTTAEVSSKWSDLQTARASLLDIAEVTRKMETIVGTLLAIARCQYSKQAINIQPVEINSLIEKVCQTYAPRAAERNIIIKINVAPRSVVQTDPALLELILINLVSNAADYATAGSTITLTTLFTAEKLRFEIANDAQGLSTDDLAQFFEPFWRKDPSASDDRHAGLGLALTKAYADALNVPLSVELREPGQLQFSLLMPLHVGSEISPIAKSVNNLIAQLH